MRPDGRVARVIKPEIIEAHRITGEDGFVVRIAAEDVAQRFLHSVASTG